VRIDVDVGEQSGNGSGLVVDDKGTIITCHHVVRPNGRSPTRIRIEKEGSYFDPSIVRLEPYKDVAILRAQGLAGTCTFKRFSDIEVGERCLIFGHPLGISHLSVLDAMVSAKGRHMIRDFPYDCVQIDGRVNRGNSGGPVVDPETGEVLGIVTAKYIPFLRSVEDLQQFVRANRVNSSGGGVAIMGIDFGRLVNAVFDMVDLLAGSLQLVQVGIGYVIPYDVFAEYLS
jgi:S1-C subfamily serine protease